MLTPPTINIMVVSPIVRLLNAPYVPTLGLFPQDPKCPSTDSATLNNIARSWLETHSHSPERVPLERIEFAQNFYGANFRYITTDVSKVQNREQWLEAKNQLFSSLANPEVRDQHDYLYHDNVLNARQCLEKFFQIINSLIRTHGPKRETALNWLDYTKERVNLFDQPDARQTWELAENGRIILDKDYPDFVTHFNEILLLKDLTSEALLQFCAFCAHQPECAMVGVGTLLAVTHTEYFFKFTKPLHLRSVFVPTIETLYQMNTELEDLDQQDPELDNLDQWGP